MTVALWSVWSKRSKYLQFVLMPYFYTVLCICHLLCAQWVAVIHTASIKLRLDIGNSKKKKTVSYKIISFLIVFLAIAWHHSATSRKCVFNETCTKAMWNQSLSNIPLCVNAFCLFAKKKIKKVVILQFNPLIYWIPAVSCDTTLMRIDFSHFKTVERFGTINTCEYKKK